MAFLNHWGIGYTRLKTGTDGGAPMDFPFKEIILAILQLIPFILLNPSYAFLYWLIVAVVALQYRRLAALQERILGVVRNSALEQTLGSIVAGIAAGFLGSLILVGVGVTLHERDVIYLWPAAFALMLINPRLMCFSYAGGLVSLSYLVFGVPEVSVTSITALVAVLHVVESILIWLNGARGALPVYIRPRRGRILGGYTIQNFWPVPIVLLILKTGLGSIPPGDLIAMPDWWPLLRPGAGVLDDPSVIPVLAPVPAVLGYGDLAITALPRSRTRRSAFILAGYSLTLLGLSVLASHFSPLLWAAAIFAPLGHEAVAHLGGRAQLRGKPYFSPPPAGGGVAVMEPLPDSTALRAGIRARDVITHVNERPVGDAADLESALVEEGPGCTLTVRREGRTVRIDLLPHWRGTRELGIIHVPSGDEDAHVAIGGYSLLRSLWKRAIGRRRISS